MTSQTTYYATHKPVWLIVGLAFLFYVFLTWLLDNRIAYPLIALGLGYLFLAQTFSLSISEQGMVFYYFGFYKIHTRWENLERVVLVKNKRYLQLKIPVKLGSWTSLIWSVPQTQREKLIPLDDWEKVALIQKEIMRYAPQINLLDY